MEVEGGRVVEDELVEVGGVKVVEVEPRRVVCSLVTCDR
jgi:hypothetical protein